MQRWTVERVLQIALFILIFALATRPPIDTDTWWHLRSGEYTLTQSMIYTDPFSHTFNGERWINHSWGAQVILYGVYQALENAGLALLTAGLACGGILLLFPISAGNSYLRAFVLIAAAASAAIFWSARPQMFSFFGTALLLFLLYRAKQGRQDWLWAIVPLMLGWANLHAGYSIGFLILLAFIVGEAANHLLGAGETRLSWAQWRRLLLISGLSVGVLLLTPYGVDTLRVPFETVSIGPLRQYIQEWASPEFQGRETWPMIGLLLAFLGAAWANRKVRFDWTSFFLIAGTLFLALLYGRNIPVFTLAIVPTLTLHLQAVLVERGWDFQPRVRVTLRQARLNQVLLLLIVLGALGYVVQMVNQEAVQEAQAQALPVAAVEHLNATQPPGPIFNSYNWGGYLIQFARDYPVFIDGRTDLYTDFLVKYVNTATAAARWRETLAEYDIRLVLVERGSGLDLALRTEPGWVLDYEDELAVLFVRTAEA